MEGKEHLGTPVPIKIHKPVRIQKGLVAGIVFGREGYAGQSGFPHPPVPAVEGYQPVASGFAAHRGARAHCPPDSDTGNCQQASQRGGPFQPAPRRLWGKAVDLTLPPGVQFRGERPDAGFLTFEPVNGEALIPLPILRRPGRHSKIRGNLLPSVQGGSCPLPASRRIGKRGRFRLKRTVRAHGQSHAPAPGLLLFEWGVEGHRVRTKQQFTPTLEESFDAAAVQ